MPAPREVKQVGPSMQLPVLPERYDYTGQTSSEGSIVQVLHVSSGYTTSMSSYGFEGDYDKAVAVLDSIVSCVAPEKLNEDLAKIGKTLDAKGAVVDLPKDDDEKA